MARIFSVETKVVDGRIDIGVGDLLWPPEAARLEKPKVWTHLAHAVFSNREQGAALWLVRAESDGEQAEEMIMEMPGQDYTTPLRERYAGLAALLGVEGDDQVVLVTPPIDMVDGLPSIPAE